VAPGGGVKRCWRKPSGGISGSGISGSAVVTSVKLAPGRLRLVGERRVTSIGRHVGLADVGPDARARLDALARIVQDVSDFDAASAPVDAMGLWILRRLAIDIASTPRFRAEVTARTWCSGVGARWAERTTQLHLGDRLCVEAIAIWVHTDPERGVPTPLPPGFDAVWGATAAGRKVTARLRHGAPPSDARRQPWSLRATDLDVVGHVNNAAYWAAIEEELARRGRPRVRHAEIEFRTGLDLADAVDVVVADTDDGFAAWLCVGGDVRASVLVGCESCSTN
jgi:acyl-ACP thioesterase